MFVKIISGIGIVAFLAIVGLLLVSSFSIPGLHLNARVVETGSMEPTIPTGSVVFVSPATHYTEGDIVTFKRASDMPNMPPITHRVLEVHVDGDQYRYVTKGDANGIEDTKDVQAKEIIGMVRLHIPWVGYALRFVRTLLGFVALVILPIGLIVVDEVQKIVREVRKKKALLKAVLLCVLALGVSGCFVGRTEAAFTASATIEGNSATTAVIPPPFVRSS